MANRVTIEAIALVGALLLKWSLLDQSQSWSAENVQTSVPLIRRLRLKQ
jgi:hypothetical protein